MGRGVRRVAGGDQASHDIGACADVRAGVRVGRGGADGRGGNASIGSPSSTTLPPSEPQSEAVYSKGGMTSVKGNVTKPAF